MTVPKFVIPVSEFPTLGARRKIFNVLVSMLSCVPKTYIEKADNFFSKITISNTNEFIPDFELVWCPQKKHYRVYILVASRTSFKVKAGYAIMVIKSPMVAGLFCGIYKLIYSNRSNQKEGV